MKLAQLFMRTLPRIAKSAVFPKSYQPLLTAGFTGLGLSLAAWMTTTKVFS